MTRSRPVALLVAASLALSACNAPSAPVQNDSLGAVYPDEASCLQSYTAEECREYRLVAEREHVETAPKYADTSSCERAQGAGHCQSVRRPDGSSVIVPMLAGFVIGAAIGNALAPKPKPLYYGASRDCPPGQSCQSLYSGSGYVGRAAPPAPGAPPAPITIRPTPSTPPTARFAPPATSPATGPKIPPAPSSPVGGAPAAVVPVKAPAAPPAAPAAPAPLVKPAAPSADSVVNINPPARPIERPAATPVVTAPASPPPAVRPPPPPPPPPPPATRSTPAPVAPMARPSYSYSPAPSVRPTITIRGK